MTAIQSGIVRCWRPVQTHRKPIWQRLDFGCHCGSWSENWVPVLSESPAKRTRDFPVGTMKPSVSSRPLFCVSYMEKLIDLPPQRKIRFLKFFRFYRRKWPGNGPKRFI